MDTLRLSVPLRSAFVPDGDGWSVSGRLTEAGTEGVAFGRVLDNGARLGIVAGRATVEVSVPKVLAGPEATNVLPASAADVQAVGLRLVRDVELLGVDVDSEAVRVTRLDCVRDFTGCEDVPALLASIGQAPTSGRMVRAVYADPHHGGAQTVFTRTGKTTGVGARLYDKSTESGTEPGHVRFEAQERRRSLEAFYGALLSDVASPAMPPAFEGEATGRWLRAAGAPSVPHADWWDASQAAGEGVMPEPVRLYLPDVDDGLVLGLAARRWEWSGYGRPVRPVSDLVRAVLTARDCEALTEGQALQALGYATAVACGMGDAWEKSRRSRCRAYLRTAGFGGLAAESVDRDAAAATATGRTVVLDFHEGYRAA